LKRENQLVNGGAFLFCFGLLAFLPSITDRELLILAWLGAWQVPIGISSMVVGAILWAAGKIQSTRSASPVEPPTAPSSTTVGISPAREPTEACRSRSRTS
jgi:hypothetical protein